MLGMDKQTLYTLDLEQSDVEMLLALAFEESQTPIGLSGPADEYKKRAINLTAYLDTILSEIKAGTRPESVTA